MTRYKWKPTIVVWDLYRYLQMEQTTCSSELSELSLDEKWKGYIVT